MATTKANAITEKLEKLRPKTKRTNRTLSMSAEEFAQLEDLAAEFKQTKSAIVNVLVEAQWNEVFEK